MRTRGYSFQLSVVGLIVVLDQLTKLLIRRQFELYDSAVVIPNLFSLTRIHNTGAAYGLLDHTDLPFKTGLLALVSVAALIGLVMFAVTLPEIHRLARIGVALVVGGALGNLIDRLAHGVVVDFVSVGLGTFRTGIFNLADVAITLGVVLVALHDRHHAEGEAPL